mgnify:FL=1
MYIRNFLILLFVFYFIFSGAASASTIKWFFSTSPFERKNNEIQLEWAIEGGGGSSLRIDCEMGKISFLELGSLHKYNCGDLLMYGDKQNIYAAAFMAKDNSDWTTAKFNLFADGDQKSFEMDT